MPESDPIAPAETLEQLAEIAHNTWYNESIPDEWNTELPERRKEWEQVVIAILRAAKPELNICSASTWRSGESVLYAADLPSLNSYIRYRVELPPDEWKAAVDDALVCCDMTADSFASPRDAVQALLTYHKDVDDFFARDEMRERQVACFIEVYTRRMAARTDAPPNELAMRAAMSLPEHIACLTVALDEKGGE